MSDLHALTDDELLVKATENRWSAEMKVAIRSELRRRLAVIPALTAELEEARKQVRLHVECMCGHLIEDHDYDEGHGECTEFGTGSGGGEVECFCENFRPAWAAWWQRADESEALIATLTAERDEAYEDSRRSLDRLNRLVADRTGGIDSHTTDDYLAHRLHEESERRKVAERLLDEALTRLNGGLWEDWLRESELREVAEADRDRLIEAATVALANLEAGRRFGTALNAASVLRAALATARKET